jgi:hypothetical protein
MEENISVGSQMSSRFKSWHIGEYTYKYAKPTVEGEIRPMEANTTRKA